MGCGASAAPIQGSLAAASPEELQAALADLGDAERAKVCAALAAIEGAKSVPEEVVRRGMAAFEEKYNAGDFEFCGSCYTDECHVTVNGGKDAGGFGPFTTPAEVAGFLKTLRDDMGAKDMKFAVTDISGSSHKDTWDSAAFTGACDAVWVQVGGAPLGWKIKQDAIQAAPKVPDNVVRGGMAAFEEKYNAGDFEFCGSCYTDECHVTVNGGADAGGFGPFTTPAEVAGFLKTLRDDMGAKDMKFAVTDITGSNHKDTWDSATFTGACDAVWVQVEGAPLGWKIKQDAIQAAPKVPDNVVRGGMAAFEEKYNAGDFEFCGSCYTDECHVTVNGGTDAGGFGPFTTPAEVAGFLKTLRDDMGAKDMKFAVTDISGSNHKDTWDSATFTGACDADWVQVEGAPLGWKIKRDSIAASPK